MKLRGAIIVALLTSVLSLAANASAEVVHLQCDATWTVVDPDHPHPALSTTRAFDYDLALSTATVHLKNGEVQSDYSAAVSGQDIVISSADDRVVYRINRQDRALTWTANGAFDIRIQGQGTCRPVAQ